jgi:hypothetical protein
VGGYLDGISRGPGRMRLSSREGEQVGYWARATARLVDIVKKIDRCYGDFVCRERRLIIE